MSEETPMPTGETAPKDKSAGFKATERIEAGPGPGRGPMGGGMVGQKAMNFGPSAKRLMGHLRPERFRVILVVILSAVAVALSTYGPKVLGKATDLIFEGFIGRNLPAGTTQEQAVEGLRAAGQGTFADIVAAMEHLTPGVGIDFDAVRNVLLFALGLYVVAMALMWISGMMLNRAVNNTVRQMREDVEEKIHRLPLSYFDRSPRGELLSRVTNDIDNIAQSLQQTLSQLLNAVLSVVGVLVMMIWISPLLALIALVTVPISLVVTGTIMKRSQGQFIAQWRATGGLNAQIEEAYSGHSLVSVYGRRAEIERRFAEENDELYQVSFKAQFISGLIMPAMMFIGNINYVLIAVIGALRVSSGALSIGEVQAFVQYTRQFTQPLTQVASMMNLLQSGVASAERVFELLDAEEEADAVTGQTSREASSGMGGSQRGQVVFEHVSFRYETDRPLIDDLSLVAKPGQTVAIVGPTGAGKTTLVNLVMRFYDIDSGRITLDGVDITKMTREQLRSQVGMVLQDAWLFGGTIRDNLAYGRPDATEEEILEAAKATYVDRFVHSLPDGYDTVIDDEGSNLSAGERQLITIARAFLTKPSLLILDEATSSVDTRTEVLVQHAMSALRKDRTSFVIAHRLSTIRDADLILVMEDGAIVEQGNHDELLAAEGAYARLYQSQFAGAAAPIEDEADAALVGAPPAVG